MSVEQLAKQIWVANPGITFEEARERAARMSHKKETRELKQIRVVRAEEVR